MISGHAFEGIINVKLTDNGNLFHDITKIRDISGSAIGQTLISSAAESSRDASSSIVSQGNENVNAETAPKMSRRDSRRVSEEELRRQIEELKGDRQRHNDVVKMQKALTEYYHATIPALELQEDIRAFAKDVRTDQKAEG